MSEPIVNLKTRFWPKVERGNPDECWEWTAAKHQFGYGMLGVNSKVIYAHRFSWQIHFGDIPPGMEVCHSCDNPPCVNPNHLFLGTQTDNVYDMQRKGRHRGGSMPGESHPQSKLTKKQVRAIREQYAQGEISQRALAEQYGMCQSAIGNIIRRKSWKHC